MSRAINLPVCGLFAYSFVLCSRFRTWSDFSKWVTWMSQLPWIFSAASGKSKWFCWQSSAFSLCWQMHHPTHPCSHVTEAGSGFPGKKSMSNQELETPKEKHPIPGFWWLVICCDSKKKDWKFEALESWKHLKKKTFNSTFLMIGHLLWSKDKKWNVFGSFFVFLTTGNLLGWKQQRTKEIGLQPWPTTRLSLYGNFWLASKRLFFSLLIAFGRDVHGQTNCEKRKDTFGCEV